MLADGRGGPCLWRPIHRPHLIVSPVLDARRPEALRHRTGDEVQATSAETAPLATILPLAAVTQRGRRRRRMRPRLRLLAKSRRDDEDQQDCD